MRSAFVRQFSGFIVLVAGFAVFAAQPVVAERTLDAAVYFDRLRGMWLGQLIGNLAGRPSEGVYNGASENPAASVPWVLLDVWPADDDTDLEYAIQHIYLTDGFEPVPIVLRDEWLAHMPLQGIYIANRQARYLLDAGHLPPDTGSYQLNPCWWAIDAQIETESIGALAPGLRQWAIDHTANWSHIMNDGHPVHAAQFYAALYAAAAFESDVPTLIQMGLAAIPTSSRAAAVIRDVIDWHTEDLADSQPDWRATRRKLYDYYQGVYAHGRHVNWLESTINVGATTLALLYGDGDFEPTVQIAVLAGWDSDCNPATAGGLLGMAHGYSGLPMSLTSQCGDVYRNRYRPDLPNPGPLPQDDSILAICGRWQALAEQVIVAQGGTISDDGMTRTYHIPDEPPVTPAPEQPDPDGAAGLVGALRQLGETVTVAASIERHDPADDRNDLEGVADGVTDPRYNGHRPYWTYDGNPNQPPGGDFYQLNFPREVRVDRVVFYEGDLRPQVLNERPADATLAGGFFLTLGVEVRRGGAWTAVPQAVPSEPLDTYKQYQVIAYELGPHWCDSVRVRGDAGGAQQYTTSLELEAYGRVAPPAVKGDLNGDGTVNFADINPFVLALLDVEGFIASYTDVNPFDAGDVNDDGALDFADINPFVALLL